jgi:hypothetical protein
MLPMDLSWRLLKTPLLPESIKQVSDNRVEAQFQDPKTNQVFPMIAEKDPKFGTMNVGIYPNQPGQNLGAPSGLDAMDMADKDINEDVKEMLGLGLSNAELTETNEDGPYYESDMTWTDPERRRRGYASALYDLVNQLGERKVRPSANQSDEGKQLWRKRMLPKGEPMDLAWRLLKASRQMKLYNYIEDYPGMEPVTAYRGVPFLTTKPMPGSKWYQKSTPIDLDREGTWWVEDTREPHATASWFGRLSDDPNPNPVVLGHRGELESSGYVQRRKGEWNPANDTRMDEAFVSHNKPIDWEKIVLSRPSQSVTENMDIAEHDAWLDAWSRGDM